MECCIQLFLFIKPSLVLFASFFNDLIYVDRFHIKIVPSWAYARDCDLVFPFFKEQARLVISLSFSSTDLFPSSNWSQRAVYISSSCPFLLTLRNLPNFGTSEGTKDHFGALALLFPVFDSSEHRVS